MADWLKGFLNVSEDASSCFIFVFISPEKINFGLACLLDSSNLPFASGTGGRTRPQSRYIQDDKDKLKALYSYVLLTAR